MTYQPVPEPLTAGIGGHGDAFEPRDAGPVERPGLVMTLPVSDAGPVGDTGRPDPFEHTVLERPKANPGTPAVGSDGGSEVVLPTEAVPERGQQQVARCSQIPDAKTSYLDRGSRHDVDGESRRSGVNRSETCLPGLGPPARWWSGGPSPMFTFLVLVVIVIAVGFWLVSLYNKLVAQREATAGSWGQIDVELRRRNDLVPNLVETVKGYAAHERQTLEAVISARNAVVSASGPKEAAVADNLMTGLLRQVFALSEAYPALKADQSFLRLQEELAGTEGRIALARSAYNDSVMRLNTTIASFPANLFAGKMSFTAKEYFEAPVETHEVPQVRF